MTYGWVQIKRGMAQKEVEKEEKRRARLALVPVLVAERDARQAAYQKEWNELEAKVRRNRIIPNAKGACG